MFTLTMGMIQQLKNFVSPGTPPALSADQPSGQPHSVLIVDDEAEMRMIGRIALEQVGFQVLEAENGASALAVCEKNPNAIALVITDVLMPRMDGFTLVRRLQALRPSLPVILLSGHIVEEDLWGDSVAEVRYLPKPYHLQDLQNAVIDMIGPVLSERS